MSPLRAVAVDTNLLIYLQNPNMTQHQATRALFERFLREQVRIMLPTPVAAEYLSGLFHGTYTPEALEKAHRFLTQHFGLLAFDERAVKIYAHMMSLRTHDAVWTRIRKEGGERRCLLADITILATAEAHGIPEFYSGEKRRTMRTLAERAGLRIQVKYLDELPLQLGMNFS